MSAAIEPALDAELPEPRWRQAPAEFTPGWSFLLALLDLTMFSAAAYVAAVLIFHTWAIADFQRTFSSALVLIVIWLFIFERVGLYRRSFALSVRDEFYFTVAALSVGILPQLLLFTLVPAISTSRLHLLLSVGLSIVAVGGTRAITHNIRALMARGRPRRIAIVGEASRIATVQQSLNVVDGTQILKLEVADVEATINGINLAQDRELDRIQWFHDARHWDCDTLILTEMLPPHVVPHLLEICGRWHVKVAFAPPRFQRHAYSLSLQTDGRQALILPAQLGSCTPTARLVKRIFDIAIALPAVIVFSPVMLLASIVIGLESGRPILYRQKRVGRDGAVFELLKFRSMRVDAETITGPIFAKQRDERTTAVGAVLRRTSIDELPQLFNVLRGEMSIVGPRPERPMFVERFRKQFRRYDERHLVRPGITGWSQVQMKRALNPEDSGEKLSYDLFYVEQWSLFMDLSVIFKTAIEVLFHRPA